MKTNRQRTRAARLLLCLLLALIVVSAGGALATTWAASSPLAVDPHVTTPKAFFGYDIGTDYQLTPWQTITLPDYNTGDPVLRKGIVEYAHELQRTSNRVRVFQEGTSEMGRPMILTVITSAQNWAHLNQIKANLKKLADPRQVSSDSEARTLADQGKAVYWLSAAIHSTERTSPEVLLRLGYDLAAGQDSWTRDLLNNVIVVLENTINPDGLEQVTESYYNNHASTPGYGKYVNHDDNRDFIGAGLVETQQNIQARYEWMPTVYHDLHEAKDMLYMSPGNDPTNEAVNSIVMDEWTGFAGHNIGQLTAAGWKGAFYWDYADMWYPGYNHGYTFMHNSNGRFYELQGASLGSPRTIGAGAHSTTGILNAWKTARTYWDPAPYPPGYSPSGDGKWHLMDAVNLEETAIKNDLDYTLSNKTDLLMDSYLIAKSNMAKATGEAPYAFVIPANGGDNADVTDMINNLRGIQHIEVDRLAQPTVLDGQPYAAGDYVVRTDQPFGLTAKNLLMVQNYPAIKTPYDVTAWTYGLARDVKVIPQGEPLPAGLALLPVTAQVPYAGTLTGGVVSDYIVEHGSNNNLAVALPRIWANSNLSLSQADAAFTADGRSFPAGTFVVHTTGSQADHDALKAMVESLGLIAYSTNSGLPPGAALRQPRVAMYARYAGDFSDTTEGWMRIQLDNAGWAYTRLHSADVTAMDPDAWDVLIVPSISTNSFANAIGDAGLLKVQTFVQNGGTLLLFESSSRLPVDKGWISGVTVAPPAALGPAAKAAEAQSQTDVSEEDLPDFGGQAPPGALKAAAATAAAPAADVPVNCPGSIVRVSVDPATRVGYGYDATESMWCETNLFFSVATGATAQVVASYPDDGNTLLLSGFIAGESWMHGKAAIIDAPLGSGHLVMISPNVVYRAQTTGTYMFFWNALFEGSR